MSKVLLKRLWMISVAMLVMGPSLAGASDIVMEWEGGSCVPPGATATELDIVSSGSSFSCGSLRFEDYNGEARVVAVDDDLDQLQLRNAKIVATANITNYPITIRKEFVPGPTIPDSSIEVYYKMEGKGIFGDDGGDYSGESNGNKIQVDSRITHPVNSNNNLDQSDYFEVVCWFGFCSDSDLAFDESQLHSSGKWIRDDLSGDRELKLTIYLTLDQNEYVSLNFVKLFNSGSPDISSAKMRDMNLDELRLEMRKMIRDYHKMKREIKKQLE